MLSQVRLVLNQRSHVVTCRFAKSDTEAAAIPPVNISERINDRYASLQDQGLVDQFETDVDALVRAWNSVRLDDSLLPATLEMVPVGKAIKWNDASRKSFLRSISATSFGINVFIVTIVSGLILLLSGATPNDFLGLGYALGFASIFVSARLALTTLRKARISSNSFWLNKTILAEDFAMLTFLLFAGGAVFAPVPDLFIYGGVASTLCGTFFRLCSMKTMATLLGSQVAKAAFYSGLITTLKFCAIWITAILILYTGGMAPESTTWLRGFALGGGALVVLSSFISAFNRGLSSLHYDVGSRGRNQQSSARASSSQLRRVA